MHGRIASVTLSLLLLAASPALADVPSGNLVVNPGAEADPATPAGWTTTNGFATELYGQGGFPDAPADGGARLFTGGPDPGAGGVATAAQTIDVTVAAPEIDAGRVTAALSALLGGFSSQADQATVTLQFLAASGGETGPALTIGPVTDVDRGGVSAMLPRSGSAAVPSGTRTLAVTITATRFAGSYDDGYADNVSVSLTASAAPQPTPSPSPGPSPVPVPAAQEPPPPVFHQTVTAGRVSGTIRFRRPGSRTFVTLAEDRSLPLGSVLDTKHGVMELTSVPRAGGTPQTAQFHDGLFKVTQPGGITQLALTEKLARCRRASAAAKKPKTRRLWGSGKGAFRISGSYSSATVRGTKWLVQDSCAGTLTRVTQGVVSVRDNVRHKSIVVRAGHRYLARPKR